MPVMIVPPEFVAQCARKAEDCVLIHGSFGKAGDQCIQFTANGNIVRVWAAKRDARGFVTCPIKSEHQT